MRDRPSTIRLFLRATLAAINFLLAALAIGSLASWLIGCATTPAAPITAQQPEPAKPNAIQTVLDFFEPRD